MTANALVVGTVATREILQAARGRILFQGLLSGFTRWPKLYFGNFGPQDLRNRIVNLSEISSGKAALALNMSSKFGLVHNSCLHCLAHGSW